MESLRVIVWALIVFGNTITTISAGHDIRNLFDIDQPQKPPVRPLNSFLTPSFGRSNYQGTVSRQLNENDLVKPRPWSEVTSKTPLPVIQNLFNDVPKTTPHYDAIVIKSVSDVTTEENTVKINSRFKDEDEDTTPTYSTPKPTESTNNYTHIESNDDESSEQTTEKTLKENSIGVITKKHFYFQVQPVRPEGETEIASETVYYVE